MNLLDFLPNRGRPLATVNRSRPLATVSQAKTTVMPTITYSWCREEVYFFANGGSRPTTYQYRAPELFVWKKFRGCSYPCDVWAMGVSIAHMDLGTVPFGRLQMQRSQMEDIFADQLRVLCKANSEMFDVHVRKDPTQFLKKLGRLTLREASCLPWGRSRGTVVQDFLRKCFFLSPESRPLAKTLVRETALPR